MAKKGIDNLNEILRQVANKQFATVYLLMGEEPYFIDQISDAIVDGALREDERDFNLTVLYGGETTTGDVLNAVRRYPMMADRQVVVVKEAQQLDGIEKLEPYLENQLQSTILVLCYKYKSYDSRKKLFKLTEKTGVVFESKKLYENQVPDFISKSVKERGYNIQPRAIMLLAESVGSDLIRITSELDKLCIGTTGKEISLEQVATTIGISKDFNNFELIRAIAMRDFYKMNLIVAHFKLNPKNNPPVVTLSLVFNFFANLMLCYYAKDKSERGLMIELSLRNSFAVKDYLAGMKMYNAFKTMENITLIREYDARMKGINSQTDVYENLRELLFKLSH